MSEPTPEYIEAVRLWREAADELGIYRHLNPEELETVLRANAYMRVCQNTWPSVCLPKKRRNRRKP